MCRETKTLRIASDRGFWTEIKRLVYADNWQAENLRQLRNRFDYCMKKIDRNRVQWFGASTFTTDKRIVFISFCKMNVSCYYAFCINKIDNSVQEISIFKVCPDF